MAEEMAESSHFGLLPIAEGTEADEVRAQVSPQIELQETSEANCGGIESVHSHTRGIKGSKCVSTSLFHTDID